MNKDNDEIEKLLQCFELQLSEVEMLTSMYPNPSEFYVTIPSILADMNRFVSGETRRIPNELDFTWNINLEDVNAKLEVNVTLPHSYPEVKPCISARSSSLNRAQHQELNIAISSYVQSLSSGDLCIIALINWLTENAQTYFTLEGPSNKNDQSFCEEVPKDSTLCRMWIYSHHIYSKFKRRDIIDLSHDLKLTGFSLPGKPGLICVEGMKRNCGEFLQHLKQMTWKKLSLVKEETGEAFDESSQKDFCKFGEFQEISFQVRRGPAKEYHMDMGQFFKYLEEHNCAYAFHDIFGFEGHTSTDK